MRTIGYTDLFKLNLWPSCGRARVRFMNESKDTTPVPLSDPDEVVLRDADGDEIKCRVPKKFFDIVFTNETEDFVYLEILRKKERSSSK